MASLVLAGKFSSSLMLRVAQVSVWKSNTLYNKAVRTS